MKTTNISNFKTHISRILRAVRNGERFVILDRDIPVAEVVPCTATEPLLTVRPPTRGLVFRKLELSVDGDPIEYLREERGNR